MYIALFLFYFFCLLSSRFVLNKTVKDMSDSRPVHNAFHVYAGSEEGSHIKGCDVKSRRRYLAFFYVFNLC